jgi:antitoxin (DNA-binding transcriptional repressor) of toxin-antitoxin stability system
MQRTMKSRDVRANWSAVLRDAEKGRTIVVQQYDRTVARIVPIRSLRATAYTLNDGAEATVSISGLHIDECDGYVDYCPTAHGRRDGELWRLTDNKEGRYLCITGASLDEAIRSWAGQIGYVLDSVTIDPEHDADPDADW